MAGVSIPTADVLLSRRVQEMVLKGEEPPPLYICRDGDTEDVSSALSSIPVHRPQSPLIFSNNL